MSKSFKIDLTGKRFGRLTVLEFVPNDKHASYWKCQCDCGNVTVVAGSHLKGGDVVSCGCWNRENISRLNLKHGCKGTRLYHIWDSMKARCFNSNQKYYKDYGGRGITVCNEWRNDFQVFYDWAMSNGYNDNLTIDRINNNGNYEPSNCRWADKKEQGRNKRNNIKVEYEGERICLSELAERVGIKWQTLFSRYQRGYRGDKLFRPVKNIRRDVIVEYKGENMTLAKIAKCLGISRKTLYTRYSRGEQGEKLFRPVDVSKRSKK